MSVIAIHIRPLKKFRWHGMVKMTQPESEFSTVQDFTSAKYFDKNSTVCVKHTNQTSPTLPFTNPSFFESLSARKLLYPPDSLVGYFQDLC
jgi:hypothetical protein